MNTTANPRVVITGGTGLVGSTLAGTFSQPTILSRRPDSVSATVPGAIGAGWDPSAGSAPAEALAGADVIYNLAGEPIASGRWSDEKRRRIIESRKLATRTLVNTIASLDERPRVLVSASAIGFYGDRGDERLDEASAAGEDFLAEVCKTWEDEAVKAEALGVRVVRVRIGVALSPEGGALGKMLLPFKMGAGGRVGSGKQWMSWIHLDDLVRLLRFVALESDVSGPVNATAPEPVRNAEFTDTLGSVLRRPTVIPLPKFALRAVAGEASDLLLASQRVHPNVAMGLGFAFEFSELQPALEDLVGRR